MALLHLLASEGLAHKTLWNPTIIGILTVVAAVGLFCGSAYLLLSTNLGARLGFLVAASGLSAFMVLLTTLWLTSGNSGIDPPHGNSPSWKVIEVITDPEGAVAAQTAAVRGIETNGKPVDTTLLANLRPALDEALVQPTAIGTSTPPERPLARFGTSTDFLTGYQGNRSFEQGGTTRNVFWHTHRYAVVELCPARTGAIPPECDPLQDPLFAVLSYDFGSLRLPVVGYWFLSIALLTLSLLGLHWWERDERARTRAALTPVPTRGS